MALVLVADDNPVSLRFLVEALASCGCDCVAAEDGHAAMRHATTSTFDLLVLDARMPGLDGAELLQRLRATTAPSAQTVAIATTAADNSGAIASLRAAGFVDVLLKPIGVDALRHAVMAHLRDVPASAELDDAQASIAAGGDAAIVASLRGLFAAELEGLPAEIAALRARDDRGALRDRLHRLDASVGFCGAPALARAIHALRATVNAPAWPERALADLLEIAERTRQRLAAKD